MSSSPLTRIALVALAAHHAYADTPSCRVVDVDFNPGDELQIVAWVEKADGTFIDTVYITKKTGLYGMGNRPGRYDFNSGPTTHDLWPYGRRINTFPVWAHRHGLSWPEVVFQNGAEDDLSHPFNQSTQEFLYCMPMSTDQQPFWDTGTCATPFVGTDKGVFSSTQTSLYPPRADITRVCTPDNCDTPSVAMYKAMNPFDAVTQATPQAGATTEISWPIPTNLPQGDYVVWLEVSKGFDFNSTYNSTSYPAPTGIPYSSYGQPYRGQPSVVYAVSFTMGTTITVTSSKAYSGYGDPTGATGTLNPPDATITTDTPGSGALRLQMLDAGGDLVRVCARPEANTIPPTPITGLAVASMSSGSAMFQFVAPATSMKSCSGQPSNVAGYEVRYRANDEMTDANFADSSLAAVSLPPVAAGMVQSFELDGLLPLTNYWIGIRAYDDCRNYSPVAILPITTPDRVAGEVDACFVATAAYGSLMANDVEMLRSFRDSVLRSTVFGELAIETYYTFGPTVAGVVGESELLRATARDVLRPVIGLVKSTRF